MVGEGVEGAILAWELDVAREVGTQPYAAVDAAEHLADALAGMFGAGASVELGDGGVESDGGKLGHGAWTSKDWRWICAGAIKHTSLDIRS